MKKPDLLENPEILQTLKKEVKKHGEAECTMGSISVVLRKVTLIGGKAYYYLTPLPPHSFKSKYLDLCDAIHLREKGNVFAAYPINELIKIVKSGNYEFC